MFKIGLKEQKNKEKIFINYFERNWHCYNQQKYIWEPKPYNKSPYNIPNVYKHIVKLELSIGSLEEHVETNPRKQRHYSYMDVWNTSQLVGSIVH
jgi:hypothetical protein